MGSLQQSLASIKLTASDPDVYGPSDVSAFPCKCRPLYVQRLKPYATLVQPH